jgi:hypothetical protein
MRINDEDWHGQKNWGKEMIDLCKFAMGNDPTKPNNPYHGNWAIRFKEIECPKNLTNVTGLRLKDPTKGYDGKTLPKPALGLVKSSGRDGNTPEDGFPGWTSSMMDCCKPSCSVNDMVPAIQKHTASPNDVDPLYPSIFMCDKDGKKMYQTEEDIEKVYIVQNGKKTACYDTDDLLICKDKLKDWDPDCTTDADCCSNVCSIQQPQHYNSMCCPRGLKPDGNGNCQ